MTDEMGRREFGRDLVSDVRNGRMSRRELVRRAGIMGFGATSVGTLLTACGGSGDKSGTPATSATAAAGEPRRGGQVRVLLTSPAAAVEPVTMYDAGSIAIVQQVAEYLVWVENDLSLRPVLAESWTPDETARTWTFKIRQGVTFSDGSPLRTEDVVASFKRLVDPKSKSTAASNFDGVLAAGGIERRSATEVVFHLDRPFVDFPYLVSSSNYNTVILPERYAADFEKRPVGTGPFLLTDYANGRSATFDRNPSYWQKRRPYLDGVRFVFQPDTPTQVLTIQGGGGDIVLSTPYEGAQALFTDPKFKIASTTSSGYEQLHMRVDREPFTDKRVRQALALSVNREQLLDVLYKGRSSLGNDHVFAPVFPTAPELAQREQDYDRARSLLAEAGIEGGFKATLTAPKTQEIPQFATLVKAAAAPIGIDIEIDIQSGTAYYGSGDNQPWLTVPLGIGGWAARAVPSQVYGAAFTSKGIWNAAHWKNPEFDRLGVQLDRTLDEAGRKEIAKKMATIQQDETPAIIAYWTDVFRASTTRVEGLKADGASFLDLTTTWVSS